MNTMEHSVLKISPSQLLFGNSLDHDVHFISHPKEYRGINKIIDHKFSRPRKFKADLQLLILWDDEKEPQWSSWSKSLGKKKRGFISVLMIITWLASLLGNLHGVKIIQIMSLQLGRQEDVKLQIQVVRLQ